MSLFKVGPHVQLGSADAVNWAKVAPMVVAIDNTSVLAQARPGTVTVFRHYFGAGNNDYNRNGADVANEVLAALGGFRPSAVVLYNEPVWTPGDSAALQRIIDFHNEAAPVIHGAGLLLAGFSFSTGTPAGDEATEAAQWLQIQAGGFGGSDFISVHEYWGNASFTEWYALRHRRASRFMNGAHPAFLITECGRDAVEGGASGWKISGISAAQYVAEIQGYGDAIDQDVYVGGAAVFTAGAAPDQDNFNTDGQLTSDLIGGGGPTITLSLSVLGPNPQIFGQQICVVVHAADASGAPVAGLNVTITVRSPHQVVTDAAGNASSICWTRNLADGVTSDTAVATGGGATSNTVTINWTQGQVATQDNTALIIAGLVGLVGVGAVAYALGQHQEGK